MPPTDTNTSTPSPAYADDKSASTSAPGPAKGPVACLPSAGTTRKGQPETGAQTRRHSVGGNGGGMNIGEKIKGAAQVVYGTGEAIRGTLLGAADSVGRGREGDAGGHGEVASKGRSEVAEGMARLRGEPGHAQGGEAGVGGPPTPPDEGVHEKAGAATSGERWPYGEPGEGDRKDGPV